MSRKDFVVSCTQDGSDSSHFRVTESSHRGRSASWSRLADGYSLLGYISPTRRPSPFSLAPLSPSSLPHSSSLTTRTSDAQLRPTSSPLDRESTSLLVPFQVGCCHLLGILPSDTQLPYYRLSHSFTSLLLCCNPRTSVHACQISIASLLPDTGSALVDIFHQCLYSLQWSVSSHIHMSFR